jgi:hypothetical protein
MPAHPRYDYNPEPEPVLKMPQPTTHRPGTEEKIVVLANRFAAGEKLYHPEDEKIPIVKHHSDSKQPLPEYICHEENQDEDL